MMIKPGTSDANVSDNDAGTLGGKVILPQLWERMKWYASTVKIAMMIAGKRPRQ